MARIDIDEIDNDDLAEIGENDVQFLGWDLDTFEDEAKRIDGVIMAHVMAGNIDLTYFNERARIVRELAIALFGDRARANPVIGAPQ